ncbi:MAG: hypothetical protein ACLPSH_09760 [Vulcanimicrobiaceae bacterium]
MSALRTPQDGLDLDRTLSENILCGGVAPARAFIRELLEDVVAGKLDPAGVLDMSVSLDDVPRGYAAMDGRSALKVMVRS